MRRRPLPTLEWERLTTHSLYDRPSKVLAAAHLGRPLGSGATVRQLLEALPDQLAGSALRRWGGTSSRPVVVRT